MNDGPFTDSDARRWMIAVQTHDGIIKYAEAMAQMLAEAGRASAKVTGDSAQTAVHCWIDVIRQRALDILKGDPASPMQQKLQKLQKLEAQMRFQTTEIDPQLLPPDLRNED